MGRDFFFFFFPTFFLLRTHTACCKYAAASCLIYLSTSNEARPRERSDRGRPLPLRQKKPLHTGVRKGCHYLVCLSVCPSVYMLVCVTFVVFTDCESCSRPISTIPVSMEAGEYGLTRGTCFFARRLEVVAVAGLLWISWCVLDGAIIFLIFFFPTFFLLRTHTACCKYEAASCLIYLY